MKILLTKDVTGLGRAGEVKDVSDGHARNFLIPRHFALPATTSVLARMQKEEQEHQAKVARLQERLNEFSNRLANQTIVIKGKADLPRLDSQGKAGKQHLFAAIHEKDIAQVLNEKYSLELEPNQIILDKALKALGIHEIGIKLSENIKVKINLDIQAL